MSNNFVFVPVLIQVALTLWLYIRLAGVKSQASKSGEVDEARRALDEDAWPDNVRQINNCIRNQFEVPVLFYVLIGILWGIGAVNLFVHAAAWAFVATRIAHAMVHTGSNYVPLRRKLFMVGSFIVIALLLYAVFVLVIAS